MAGLYGITQSPQLVAISVHNKMQRSQNATKLVEFVARTKEAGASAANAPPKKSEAELEEERRMAEKARIAAQRANAFLKNRNNA